MKHTFLVKILSTLGFGLNGIMMSNDHFTQRLSSMVGDEFEIVIDGEDATRIITIMHKSGDKTILQYTLDGKRIVGLAVLN